MATKCGFCSTTLMGRERPARLARIRPEAGDHIVLRPGEWVTLVSCPSCGAVLGTVMTPSQSEIEAARRA